MNLLISCLNLSVQRGRVVGSTIEVRPTEIPAKVRSRTEQGPTSHGWSVI